MKNDAAVVEAGQTVGRLTAFLQKLMKKPDADEYFESHIRATLDPELEEKEMGFYQRLNTYLFQFTHYTGLINRDIKSFRTNQILYLMVYFFGLIVVPVWLIWLEYAQIGSVDEAVISWILIAFNATVLSVGIWFFYRTINKIKQINDSRKNLLEKAEDVLLACSQFNTSLFLDERNGTSPGFDNELNSSLKMNELLDDEFQTIQKSYKKYFFENEHFDYQNLAGAIRAHHALYNTRIKTNAQQAQQQRDEYFRFAEDNELNNSLEKNIEEVMLKRHLNQIKNIHKFYGARIQDIRNNKKTK